MNDKRYLYRGFHPDEKGKTTIVVNGEKIKGEWVYGSHYQNDTTDKGKSFIVVNDFGFLEVIPETVGQFVTTDKNGKDVFYNDYVKDCFDRILKVIYKSFKPMLELISYDKSQEWTNNFKYADIREWFDEFAIEKAELIGNKWECEA